MWGDSRSVLLGVTVDVCRSARCGDARTAILAENGGAVRIAWTGAIGEGGGVPGMGMLMLRELLRRGVSVDLYLYTHGPLPVSLAGLPGLRIITRRSAWRWGAWYSRNPTLALFSSLLSRSISSILLSVRLLIEHRRHPYHALFQLSQMELFLLGRLRRWAPPIVVHPCSHAFGELRWHRAEQAYALESEKRRVHFSVRAWLTVRARVQPKELSRADVVVGPSDRFVGLIHDDYRVPRHKLRVLRHPVDLELFTPPVAGGPAYPLTLLYISRLSARKGLEDVIALSHRLADLAGHVRLLVVGGTTLWSDYSGHLAELHPDVAKYVGGVAAEAMPALMRSATMLLVPSRYEPGSIVTGEALACGLPVVLSDEVGPSEVVAGPHVRVHRAGDLDGLEKAVRSLLVEATRDRERLRATARADAESNFSPEVVVSQLVAILGAARHDAQSAHRR